MWWSPLNSHLYHYNIYITKRMYRRSNHPTLSATSFWIEKSFVSRNINMLNIILLKNQKAWSWNRSSSLNPGFLNPHFYAWNLICTFELILDQSHHQLNRYTGTRRTRRRIVAPQSLVCTTEGLSGGGIPPDLPPNSVNQQDERPQTDRAHVNSHINKHSTCLLHDMELIGDVGGMMRRIEMCFIICPRIYIIQHRTSALTVNTGEWPTYPHSSIINDQCLCSRPLVSSTSTWQTPDRADLQEKCECQLYSSVLWHCDGNLHADNEPCSPGRAMLLN